MCHGTLIRCTRPIVLESMLTLCHCIKGYLWCNLLDMACSWHLETASSMLQHFKHTAMSSPPSNHTDTVFLSCAKSTLNCSQPRCDGVTMHGIHALVSHSADNVYRLVFSSTNLTCFVELMQSAQRGWWAPRLHHAHPCGEANPLLACWQHPGVAQLRIGMRSLPMRSRTLTDSLHASTLCTTSPPHGCLGRVKRVKACKAWERCVGAHLCSILQVENSSSRFSRGSTVTGTCGQGYSFSSPPSPFCQFGFR